jgi:hypothetical protein
MPTYHQPATTTTQFSRDHNQFSRDCCHHCLPLLLLLPDDGGSYVPQDPSLTAINHDRQQARDI